MSPTACTQAGTENADLICKITQSGALDRNKIYIIKADETPVGADTVKAWAGVTVGITNKAYVAQQIKLLKSLNTKMINSTLLLPLLLI